MSGVRMLSHYDSVGPSLVVDQSLDGGGGNVVFFVVCVWLWWSVVESWRKREEFMGWETSLVEAPQMWSCGVWLWFGRGSGAVCGQVE